MTEFDIWIDKSHHQRNSLKPVQLHYPPVNSPDESRLPVVAGRFPSTHWSVVLAAVEEQSEDSTELQLEALGNFCVAYYEPLYAYARRRGSTPEEALDLTQGFFAHLLESRLLGKTDPKAGRLRTYLLTAFRNFVSKEKRRERAQKRGGSECPDLPLDIRELEGRFGISASERDTPEQIFERRWALNLLEQALAKVGKSYDKTGRGKLFERLRETLTGASPTLSYHELAEELGINEGAVKTAVHRLRSRFLGALQELIAETVMNESEVEDELRYLKRLYPVLATSLHYVTR
jgi:RNA polymerase sigma factor (sigma-70 family)